jgi:hypothetical protein
LPVIFEMLVTPAGDWEVALAFRNPAMDASSWLTFAPEYLTLLKFKSIVPLSARMISAVFTDLRGPTACTSRFIVPAPFTLSSELTP